MELSPYLQSIAEDLERVTALADDSTRSVAGRLLTALEPSLRMALVQAVSDAVAVVSAELDGVVAVVRMEGRDPVIAVEHTGEAPAHQPPAEDEGDDGARVTVRLPQRLKQRAETLAAEADQSLNTWIVQAIRRSTHADAFIPAFATHRAPGARRVTGWAWAHSPPPPTRCERTMMTTDPTSTRSQELTDVQALRLTNERGDVRIRCSTTDGTARVRLAARGDVDLAPVELRSEGGTLVVDIPALTDQDGPPGFTLRLGPISLGSLGSSSTPVDVEVDLPAGSDITARTKLGDIRVDGEAGAVTVRTGAGDISVESAEEVRLACGSGDVSVRSCRGGDITTGAGDISVDEALGAGLHCRAGAGAVLIRHNRNDRVSVATGSGDVTVHLAEGSLECRSGTGNVETIVPRGVPVWLDLTSGTGRVTKEVESVGAPEEGQSHLSVRVRTGVGNVVVRH